MGLFDEATARTNCEELAAYFRVLEILSECTGLQALLEAADAPTTKSLIVNGPSEPPFDGESYTIGELESRIAWAQLYPKLDQDSFLVAWSKAVDATPEKEGFFRLHIRRQVRQSEYIAAGGRADVWLYFWYLSSLMCEQYVEATDLNLRSEQIKRVQGPMFSLPHQPNWPELGYYIYADFLIPWGGSESSQ